MFAVIATGGKQYLVKPGDTLEIEKLEVEAGKPVVFDQVLLVSDKTTSFGDPTVNGAKVEATVISQFKTKKVVGIKFHNKVRYRRKFGHRQQKTKVKIEKITA